MANIFITGASGFIGSTMVNVALSLGHKVYAGIRSSSRIDSLPIDKIKIISLDLFDPKQLRSEWLKLNKNNEQIDYFIHNAGVTKSADPNMYDKVNCEGTINLYKSLFALRTPPKKFVFVSSLAAMGPGSIVSHKPIHISDQECPITAYGKSKLKAEEFLTNQTAIPFLIVRPTAVYGPKDKDFLEIFNVLKFRIEPYLADPKQQLSFIHAHDLASIICRLTTSSHQNRVYHISDGKNYSVTEFMGEAKKILDVKTVRIVIPRPILKTIVAFSELNSWLFGTASNLNREKYKELTALNWACDTDSLYSDIDYIPKYDITNGLEDVLNWYKKERLL
ncbi:NAD(P)-dependent oxidoreductase [Halosquirtibacter xylanolyticus]|uniref:NAD-dependent epimerase/dehydratase family protein n=1 Tax=Halosquirtibacter xylanolyticus TaxID=3374599 RepID=UPI0037480004|nr:NAD(P)-dependent oxidoreductase [Prolixibacteraceae bacterium]